MDACMLTLSSGVDIFTKQIVNSTGKTMINWPDSAIIYGAFIQHTTRLGLKWRDNDRQFAIAIKAKTAKQTMSLVTTGKL